MNPWQHLLVCIPIRFLSFLRFQIFIISNDVLCIIKLMLTLRFLVDLAHQSLIKSFNVIQPFWTSFHIVWSKKLCQIIPSIFNDCKVVKKYKIRKESSFLDLFLVWNYYLEAWKIASSLQEKQSLTEHIWVTQNTFLKSIYSDNYGMMVKIYIPTSMKHICLKNQNQLVSRNISKMK